MLRCLAPSRAGVDKDDPEVSLSRPADDSAPFSGLCFKIMTDPFVGSLTFCRIYSGEAPLFSACAFVQVFES